MPVDARQAHQATRRYLESELAKEHDGPTVVVTHHAPSPLSVAPRFLGSPLNPAFASDLTDMIWQYVPDMWIHGHVHDSFDYLLGDTRVIANPRGYGDENGSFDPMLVVEIGS
jgi:Icc-related predicted phosphoesterase